jgi:hypothetical protein
MSRITQPVRAPTQACFEPSSQMGSFSAQVSTSCRSVRSWAEQAFAAAVHEDWSPKRLPDGMPVQLPRRVD